MNDFDKDLLRIVADNPQLMEALKRAILRQFRLDNLGTNYPNEVLGQLTRSRLEGKELVELAFKDISHYKSHDKKPETHNPAR